MAMVSKKISDMGPAGNVFGFHKKVADMLTEKMQATKSAQKPQQPMQSRSMAAAQRRSLLGR